MAEFLIVHISRALAFAAFRVCASRTWSMASGAQRVLICFSIIFRLFRLIAFVRRCLTAATATFRVAFVEAISLFRLKCWYRIRLIMNWVRPKHSSTAVIKCVLAGRLMRVTHNDVDDLYIMCVIVYAFFPSKILKQFMINYRCTFQSI